LTTVAVIPARYASTRFPGKPLAIDTGKYLIQHVYEQVAQARRVDRVVVATEDERIVAAVKSFGGDVQMTRPDHPTGTDRVGEVAESLELCGDDLVLNVQGDEPEVSPRALDRLVARMLDGSDRPAIGTVAAPFDDTGPRHGPGSPSDPNCVKVVVDASGRAMYFSRSVIPFPRDAGGVIDRPSRWLLHMGVYAFRASVLRDITGGRMTPTSLEKTESLEQLRWMSHGLSVVVAIVEDRCVGIDTPEDYAAFVRRVGRASFAAAPRGR
jgi:3-deoxy-manno-octulosonate cytidylyltransferase (CMP-KDO synthetase)